MVKSGTRKKTSDLLIGCLIAFTSPHPVTMSRTECRDQQSVIRKKACCQWGNGCRSVDIRHCACMSHCDTGPSSGSSMFPPARDVLRRSKPYRVKKGSRDMLQLLVLCNIVIPKPPHTSSDMH